ncbi:translocation/assembly module TamB domain-containing protein [Pontibacter harenae]|uniref:translocation/assembly module TamB domain-containing protein n=1 Tax=Pontibacter harenae TaxID=2894083 RepID=UPI001E47D9DE|nr:translocation/assembly module TamB domain-containing protein [Pontibacter harenae]MCC9166573.1 translocation/assembly module TamB domain-containing protein [Pontibacter harenae]
MEKEQSINYFKVIGKALLKIVLGLILFLLLLFAVVFVAIRIPSVQTKVAQKAADYISRTINHEVTIGGVDIEFFSNVILEQVRVLDYQDRELFYIGRAEADISLFSIFQPNTLSIATLELQEPRASLVQYEGTDSLNLSTFINSLQKLMSKDTTKTSQPFNFNIDELLIANGRFTFDNFNRPKEEFGIDYFHLDVDSISGTFSEFVLEDTLQVRVTDLSAVEKKSGTRLHNLDTRMTYAATFWEWDELDLQANSSNLQKYVRFDYNRFGNFSQFIDSVSLTADIKNSKIYSKDIAIFASPLRDYDEILTVESAEISGLVSDFTANDLNIYYGDNTHIVGDLSADGLPNFQETFANIRLDSSSINAYDLKQFLPQEAYSIASRLGTVELQGRFLGFYNDFVANGTFATALGRVKSDINLKIDDNKRTSSYRGYLETQNFNLGRLIGNTDLVKTVSLSGRVEGSGFTLEDARVKVDAKINQVQLLDYNYRNIVANGTLSRQHFVGEVSIDDPNIVLAADGEIGLGRSNEAFNVLANIEKIDLQALQLTENPMTISAQANLNFRGLRLDDFVGVARFDSAMVAYNGESLALDSLHIVSEIENGQRNLRLLTQYFGANVRGAFDYSTLIADLKDLVQEYKLNFESNDVATDAYYQQKALRQGNVNDYSLTYDIDLWNAGPAIQLFMPELSISDRSTITGSFRHGNTVILELYAQLDTIQYQSYELLGNSLEINSSKLQHNPDVLAAALFTSERQVLPTTSEARDFYLEGIWSERTIDFSTSLRQPENNNRATITGGLSFLQNHIEIVFNRSNIIIRDSPWEFAAGNTINISQAGTRIEFENFELHNQNQIIRLQGVLAQDPSSLLNLHIENFDLRNLNPIIPMPIAGTLHAEASIRDFYDEAALNTVIRADSFYLENIFIGNINGKADWNRLQKQMDVDVGIDRANKKVLTLTGYYYPEATEDELDMLAVLDQSQLKLVEPFLRPIMSNLEGTMDGRIRILGQLEAPVLKGSVMVHNGQFKFDYLNTTYRFSDRVYLGPNSISFRNARVQDSYGNIATLTGGIAHDGFSDMVIDISARYRNFMVLNTTREHNELFFGTAFATGTASVLGPSNNLKIDVDARSEPNTRIVLPLDNQVSVATKDFIRFVNLDTDSAGVAIAAENQQIDLSGINMNFELDVTDDAYIELIIDRQTGDMIRGSGNGDIRMTIDTRGEFHMYGNYEITQGSYNLNLLEGLVSREFRVTPGGTISWNGDPFNGIMDITATYTQLTSLDAFNNEALVGRYPVTAVVELDGPILTPTIDLGLNFDEIPANAPLGTLDALIRSIENDENELNRQVFSILVLRRLSPLGTFNTAGAGSTAVGGSLGSLLSSQLGSFFNSLDPNLQVDIGLDGINEAALANLQVRLSYTFFEGRLRVTSQTGFGGYSNPVTGDNSNTSNYQGDWSIEYYITQSGELRGRLEYNTIPRGLGTTRGTNSQQRLSLLHTKRFDNLRELFGIDKRRRRRAIERETIILDSDPRRDF